MKLQIKHLAILLFSFVFLACENNHEQNNNSTDKSTSLVTANDSTIVIATLIGGVTTFVADPDDLKSDWQQFLNNQGQFEDCTLNSVEIKLSADSSTYFLVVFGKTSGDEDMKSTIELELDAPSCLMITGYTVTCTTTDCSSELNGCIPVGLSCTACENQGKCTKSVTNSPTVIFPSIATSTCSN